MQKLVRCHTELFCVDCGTWQLEECDSESRNCCNDT
uniref:Uncharacterized protein n=1 Tax=Arundo donax TaxID=35708 RepID=A0A0A9CQK8_ARUDO